MPKLRASSNRLVSDAFRGPMRGMAICLAGLMVLGIPGSGTAWAQRANRPADAPNPVQIETVPAGAKIRVDGKVVTDPDETTLLLLPGQHTIHVSKGNLAARAKINVVQGETNYLKLEMTPQEASIHVESDPAGSEVAVDGKSVGITPLTVQLPNGHHQIDISQVGYPKLSTPVELDAGWETNIQVELARDVATQSEWAHPSTWNWKRRTAVGIAALSLVFALGEVQAVNMSNARQDQLRSDAESANNLQTYQSIVSQIDVERRNGLNHQANVEYGYGFAAIMMMLAAFANGPREGLRGSKIDITAEPGPDGKPLLALQWGF